MEETILITLVEYEKLIKDSLMLRCLETMGVDNWYPGYEDAIKVFHAIKEDGLSFDEAVRLTW